jgi:hypothetical protein
MSSGVGYRKKALRSRSVRLATSANVAGSSPRALQWASASGVSLFALYACFSAGVAGGDAPPARSALQ